MHFLDDGLSQAILEFRRALPNRVIKFGKRYKFAPGEITRMMPVKVKNDNNVMTSGNQRSICMVPLVCIFPLRLQALFVSETFAKKRAEWRILMEDVKSLIEN